MKIIIFGATGMVGQGVMRECLNDAGVTEVLSVGRTLTGLQHARLKELVHRDLLDYTAVEKQLAGYDACFFCLGATAAGRTEAEYAAINHAIPVAAGTALARINPGMTFTYVSGGRHRQHGPGPHHVGAGEGADRERAAAPAAQGLHVQAWRHPAHERRGVQNRGLSCADHAVQAAVPGDCAA